MPKSHHRPKYARYLPLDFTLLVCDVCLSPLVLLGFLWRKRELARQRDAEFGSRFGVLYEPYAPHVTWYESSILLRRLAYAAIDVALFDRDQLRYYTFALLTGGLLVAHIVVQPFGSRTENLMEGFSGFCLLLLATTLMLNPDNTPLSQNPKLEAAAVALVCVPAGVLLVVTLERLANKWRGRRHRSSSTNVKGQQEQQELSGI